MIDIPGVPEAQLKYIVELSDRSGKPAMMSQYLNAEMPFPVLVTVTQQGDGLAPAIAWRYNK